MTTGDGNKRSAVLLETVLVVTDGPVTTITLNEPEPRRNALTDQMVADLKTAFADCADDADCRAVILTGAGSAFCSGGNMGSSAVGTASALSIQQNNRRRTHLVEMIASLPKPVIAAVNGGAVGAGCNLALACDLIIASDRARFGQLYLGRGLSLDWGASWILTRLVGLHKAKEFVFGTELIDAARAAEIGFVNRVVPAADLMGETMALARSMASNAPVAVALAKQALNRSGGTTLSVALDNESQTQAFLWGTYDAQEGIAAYMEKRSPEFRGA